MLLTLVGKPKISMNPTAASWLNASSLVYVASASLYKLNGDLRPLTITFPLNSLTRTVPVT